MWFWKTEGLVGLSNVLFDEKKVVAHCPESKPQFIQ
jgi:hypothetical protein